MMVSDIQGEQTKIGYTVDDDSDSLRALCMSRICFGPNDDRLNEYMVMLGGATQIHQGRMAS